MKCEAMNGEECCDCGDCVVDRKLFAQRDTTLHGRRYEMTEDQLIALLFYIDRRIVEHLSRGYEEEDLAYAKEAAAEAREDLKVALGLKEAV